VAGSPRADSVGTRDDVVTIGTRHGVVVVVPHDDRWGEGE